MHPAIGYHLSQDHLADLRHQAQHGALARAARQPHRPRQPAAPRPALPMLVRPVLAVMPSNRSIAPAGRTEALGGSAPHRIQPGSHLFPQATEGIRTKIRRSLTNNHT